MKQVKSDRSDRQLSPEKAEAILDGAKQEFLSHGYAAASMDKIAAAAGVSKATIYSHFDDKVGLFIALIQRLAAKKELFNPQKLQSMSGDPQIVLKRFAAGMLANIAADPQLLTFMRLIIGESGRFPELARAFVQNIEKPVLEMLTHYLATCPQLALADPEVAARAFIGAMIHFVLMKEVLHSGDLVPIERDRLLDGLVNLIITPNLTV
jgi:TetR/AcrR family transcriptional regulator, regulator of autoinduction and epiphytic fitness